MINEATLAPEENSERKGSWIRVNSGGKYYPLDPHEDEIKIRDIAHSLSMLCRYNGHSDKFYSVAEHCYLLSYAVPQMYKFEALLHDASEAYTSDIPRPLKYADEMEGYRRIEDVNTLLINEKYGVKTDADGATSPIVKIFDSRIVTDEKNALFKGVGFEGLPSLGVDIVGFSPQEMKDKFLARFYSLRGRNRMLGRY